MKIAVIGGGISGLATAFYLKRFSPASSITVFEADEGFGGKLKTVQKYGFSIEMGANGFSEKDTECMQLLKDAGLEHLVLLASQNSKIKYFFDNGKLYTLPTAFRELLQTKAIGKLSKARLCMELVDPRKKTYNDETLQKFCSRQIGAGNTNLFCDIAATATFASTADKISADAVLGVLADVQKTKGSFLKNIFESIRISELKIGFKKGVSNFINELSASFAFDKKVATEVVRVKKARAKWLVECASGAIEEFDKIVLATPSYVSSRLLKEEDRALSEVLKNIEYSPLAVVALGYEQLPYDMCGAGLITTKRSGTQALGIIWDSSIFPECAQDNRKLLRVIIGGQRDPLLALKEEDELLRIATAAIYETMGVYEEPMLKQIARWHKAIPNYGVGHAKTVEQIFERVSKIPGLHLSSSAFKGITLNSCIKNSRETALRVVGE